MTLQQIRYVIEVADSHSINKAAKKFYVSQPAISGAIHDLEGEIGFSIFDRTNKGAKVTAEGSQFISYARQIVQQMQIMEDRFSGKTHKEHFGVSSQHYTFVVRAFMDLAGSYGMDKYEFNISETRTANVIKDVRDYRSEIGILFLDSFNKDVLTRIFKENNLIYEPLFDCHVYVYLAASHPLASKDLITFEDLEPYPCLSFDQGDASSFYYAEEVLVNRTYDRIVKVTDRGTMLNMMTGLNGYTLCSGIICEDLNGSAYKAVRLDDDEIMHLIYIHRQNSELTDLCKKYIELIMKYEENVM